MSQMSLQFPFVLVGAFAIVMLQLLAQNQSDFISIDCGQQNKAYTHVVTGIRYTPDTEFIDTGVSKAVKQELNFQQQHQFVRIFPQGTRNCYKINILKAQKYLIRATFAYGNYDGEGILPEFELHLGPNFWDSVVIPNDKSAVFKEIIYIPMRNYIHICLVSIIDKGVPFISTIEIRRLPKPSYETKAGTSLALFGRYNMAANQIFYRFPADVNDRIWQPIPQYAYGKQNLMELVASYIIDTSETDYQLPSAVMTTAATPNDASTKYLMTSWSLPVSATYYLYLHFAELEARLSRELTVTINGKLRSLSPFRPQYLSTTTFTFNATAAVDGGPFTVSVNSTETSSYGPILNAMEIHTEKEFSVSETNQEDVDAITKIKSSYKIVKNWQGDPCNPQVYLWEGVECSYSDNNSSRIISLDLSSSELTGDIADSIANLTMIQKLDLSDNRLSGQIPDYLSQLPELKFLNLDDNDLTGTVPAGLIAKKSDGLSLSVCGNPGLTGQVLCNKKKKKKNTFVILVVVSVTVVLLVSVLAAAILWKHKIYGPKREDFGKGPHVFLNFRGEDTRDGFTTNLYHALDEAGIKTFFDDDGLKRGDQIGTALFQAIDAAKISVTIFSATYVASKWCLNELDRIIQREKSNKQVVIPVFYKVNPTDVRSQNNQFVIDELKHAKNNDMIPAWKAALTKAGTMAGFPYNGGPESKLIKEIVEKIAGKLRDLKHDYLNNRFYTNCPPDGRNKIIIYKTSSDKDPSFQNCESMIKILEQFRLELCRRDVSDPKFSNELKELTKEEPTPVLFVKGKYIGGYDVVNKLINDEPWFCDALHKLRTTKRMRCTRMVASWFSKRRPRQSTSYKQIRIDGSGGSPL